MNTTLSKRWRFLKEKAQLKKLFYICLLISTCGSFHSLSAQDDNSYVYAFKDTMNLKLIFANRGLSTMIRHRDTDEEIQLRPDNLSFIGLGGYFWDFSIKIFIPLPLNWFFEGANFDPSNTFDLQATLYRKNWFVEGAFQQYSTQYLPQGQVANSVSPYELFTQRVSVNATYLFSGKHVSIKSPFSRNVIQTRNAGSWSFTTGFSSIELEGGRTLFPAASAKHINIDSPISQMSAIGIDLMPGYAYNYGYRKFFMHFSAAAGATFQYKLYKKDTQRNTGLGIAPIYNLRAALGFDNGKYFGGISAVFNQSRLSVDELHTRQNARNLQFFVGYRLAEPEWLQNLEPPFLRW